jgi:hypothetical protein
MIDYRCQQAGIDNPFPVETLKRIYTEANGVPREVLKICSVAYELMKATGGVSVPAELIEAAISEAVIA